MIGYVCKYTPKELFKGFDEEGIKIDFEVENFDVAHSVTHNNLCSYCKTILENVKKMNIEEVLLINCCDSLRRVKDILCKDEKIKFCYIIDIPRKVTPFSIQIFKNELLKFIISYENYSSKTFDLEKFKESFSVEKEEKSDSNYISVLGGRMSPNLYEEIKKMSSLPVKNCSCTGYKNKFSNYYKDLNLLDDVMEIYASDLLNQMSCMRMENIENRKTLIKDDKLKGIIYNTIKFCDYYGFEYADLKDKVTVPMVKIESDYTKGNSEQMKTRIEALLEEIQDSKTKTKKDNKSGHFVAGIDSGSTSTNVVILNENKKILSYSIVKTGAKSIEGAYKALEEALYKAALKKDDLKLIISTGYGRISIPFANKKLTEITCHGKGANFLNKDIRTVIDIGGQDSKVIRIDENGDVKDFVMNDKCAAGTGRFLEMMAKTLELELKDMSNLGLEYTNDVTISSMCTVFAESEVIGLIAQNEEIENIVHGINKAVASKVLSLVNRVGKNDKFMITGGVSKNSGVVKEIEKSLSTKIIVPEEGQICGALGAALFALEE